MIIEMNAKNELKITSLNILQPISFSESGPSTNSSLTNVAGAFFSFDAASLKSSFKTTGLDFTFLCSTIFFTLARNRKEFITAGKMVITPIISEFPAIAIAPYIVPINNVPESPGNILLGNLWYLYNAIVPKSNGSAATNTSLLPKMAILTKSGNMAIITNPLATPFKTSIELIVLPATGIMTNINGI